MSFELIPKLCATPSLVFISKYVYNSNGRRSIFLNIRICQHRIGIISKCCQHVNSCSHHIFDHNFRVHIQTINFRSFGLIVLFRSTIVATPPFVRHLHLQMFVETSARSWVHHLYSISLNVLKEKGNRIDGQRNE